MIKQGFEVGDYFKICKNENDVGDAIEELSRIRPTLDFLIDGIVFKVNDLNQRDALGETEKFPRWAIAYKFKADEATTVLRDVVWQVSRTGNCVRLRYSIPSNLRALQ